MFIGDINGKFYANRFLIFRFFLAGFFCISWAFLVINKIIAYRKIPKGPFEGLIFGGAYLRREICVSKSIGLALQLEVNLPFLLCFTLHLRGTFQAPTPGGLTFGGAF